MATKFTDDTVQYSAEKNADTVLKDYIRIYEIRSPKNSPTNSAKCSITQNNKINNNRSIKCLKQQSINI